MEYSNDDTNLSSGNSSEDELRDQFTDSGTTTDSASETVQSSISDCESVVDSGSSSSRNQPRPFGDGLVPLFDGDRVHDLSKQRFVSSLGLLGTQVSVVAVHRNSYSSLVGQAKLRSFQIYLKAVEEKCGEVAPESTSHVGEELEVLAAGQIEMTCHCNEDPCDEGNHKLHGQIDDKFDKKVSC